MTGKQGTAEWLRGIIDEYKADGRSCTEKAKMFGIDCNHEESCTDCEIDKMRAVADRIDAERELPEGVEWPRFEDGEPVGIGDDVSVGGEPWKVRCAILREECWALSVERDYDTATVRGDYGERVKRPAPKVLDADGVPIEVGDTVWATYNGCKHIVMAVCSDGSLHPEMVTDDGCMVEYEEGLWDFAKKVTHEQPDSWILWGEDLDMAVKVGEVDKVEMMRRAKALAKAGEVE